MKNIVTLLVFICAFFSMSNAQKVVSGSAANITSYKTSNIVFDYSNIAIGHKKLSLEQQLKADSRFAKYFQKDKEKSERYFTGSVDDELEKYIKFIPDGSEDITLNILLISMNDDFENVRLEAVFTDKNGTELLHIVEVKDEDFNDAGHTLGKFIRKQIKHLK